MSAQIVPVEQIEKLIYTIRGFRVMLDSDLAKLYGVTVGNLNLAVRRNHQRFPDEFVFRLTKQEWESLRLQFAISKGRGGRRYLPYAFTRDGIWMLSSVLRSPRADTVNICIIRAFGRMGDLLATQKELARKLEQLEKAIMKQGKNLKKHGQYIQIIFSELHQLMNPPQTPAIGFHVQTEEPNKEGQIKTPQIP